MSVGCESLRAGWSASYVLNRSGCAPGDQVGSEGRTQVPMEWDLYRKVSKRQHFAQWRSLILCGFARSGEGPR